MSKASVPPTPERSLQQRLDALAKANVIRTKRAEFKQEAKAGRACVRDVLLDVPVHFESMKVMTLLLAMPKVGRGKANTLLTGCRISPSKTVGGLSQRQRTELVALMPRQWGAR